MSRRLSAQFQSHLISLIVVVALAAGSFGSSSAQVVIDMPAPKTVREFAPAAPTFAVSSPTRSRLVAASPQQDVGDLALRRYALGRTLPYDTYGNVPTYAGIRMYSYPYPVFWWGFWPWWGPCFF